MMVSQRIAASSAGDVGKASSKLPLPDPPRKRDMQQYNHYNRAGVGNVLYRHFAHLPDVLVSGEGYLCFDRTQPQSEWRYPDLVVAFGVDPDAIEANNGYEINEVGKPPDFVVEVASRHTGRTDYTNKRDDYATFGVQEYWRFDYTGGRYHDAPLAGDRLVDGRYEPISVDDDRPGKMYGMPSGYSEVLGLYLCWNDGSLRFFNPGIDEFLMSPGQLEAALADVQAERDAALERVRQLESDLER